MARIELFNNNGRLTSVKPKQQQRRAKLNGLYWAFKRCCSQKMNMLLYHKYTAEFGIKRTFLPSAAHKQFLINAYI